MKRAVIKTEICMNCIPCKIEENCSNKAIIREEDSDKPWVDFYKCRGCMKCLSYCNNGAVEETSQPCNGDARKGW